MKGNGENHISFGMYVGFILYAQSIYNTLKHHERIYSNNG